MYGLVNTMSRNSECFGRVLSRHRTVGAAEQADTRLQRQVKRSNGQQSYLPTIIVELPKGHRYSWAYRSDCRQVER